jgi:putative protein-disulfide isomerase
MEEIKMKPKIYYVFDTMCGWSYGASDVITKVHEKYKEVYDFNLVPGGMWAGDNVKIMDSGLREFINDNNLEVEKSTGKSFGDGYSRKVLQSSSVVLDSFPGAKAVIIVQNIKKEVAFSFLKNIQDAFFLHGKDMNNIKVYMDIADSFNISGEEFQKLYNSEEIKEETLKCFEKAKAMGVETFPSIVAEEDNKTNIIAEGYNSFEDLDKIFSSLVKG